MRRLKSESGEQKRAPAVHDWEHSCRWRGQVGKGTRQLVEEGESTARGALRQAAQGPAAGQPRLVGGGGLSELLSAIFSPLCVALDRQAPARQAPACQLSTAQRGRCRRARLTLNTKVVELLSPAMV